MKPVVLVIRDGWGRRSSSDSNAIKIAKTPVTDAIMKKYPHIVLGSSGADVGLPKGYQGNSEVGHLTIGSGRVVYQSLERINNAITDGSFASNPALIELLKKVLANKSRLHVMGLVQDEGVHAHMDHIVEIVKVAKARNIREIIIHAITDGRDTPPSSASTYLTRLTKSLGGSAKIGTVIGRYYAMDRDSRWVRTELAYRAIVLGEGETVSSWKAALESGYAKEETDEFIRPRIVDGYNGIIEGDGFIFVNYRYDRARQITKALIDPGFKEFHLAHPKFSMLAMTEYYSGIQCPVMFHPINMTNLLGEVISNKGYRQLRISETEKYAHVTFFFNGLNETPYKDEDRILIPSPHVATYDLKPEMSAFEITDRLVAELQKKVYHFAVINIVNGDMVGHTGKLDAAVKACETVDECSGKIMEEVLKQDGTMILFADHGNCEEMSGPCQTSHTLNPVDCVIISNSKLKLKEKNGTLADIAPTVLKIFGISQPKEMTGKSLI